MLRREKRIDGRHGEARHISTVVTTATASCWPMIAHGPAPPAARPIATGAPASAPTTVRTSRRRNAISRSISACCVAPSAVIRKLSESTAKSACVSGSW